VCLSPDFPSPDLFTFALDWAQCRGFLRWSAMLSKNRWLYYNNDDNNNNIDGDDDDDSNDNNQC
jgi:hypothetical protein